jgi:hypothetical protein
MDARAQHRLRKISNRRITRCPTRTRCDPDCRMTKRTRTGSAQSPNSAALRRKTQPFTPVVTRARHDGWTPERQVGLVEALAECGCVEEACARIGMTATAAYALRRRPDAASLRAAWDAALDFAVRRLSDAAFSRALNGVARPVFYKGEQIGERRYYDERLTAFILRHRDPVTFGKWRDTMRHEREPEAAAVLLTKLVNRLEEDAYADEAGQPRARHQPIATMRIVADAEPHEDARDRQRREEADLKAAMAKLEAELDEAEKRQKRDAARGT